MHRHRGMKFMVPALNVHHLESLFRSDGLRVGFSVLTSYKERGASGFADTGIEPVVSGRSRRRSGCGRVTLVDRRHAGIADDVTIVGVDTVGDTAIRLGQHLADVRTGSEHRARTATEPGPPAGEVRRRAQTGVLGVAAVQRRSVEGTLHVRLLACSLPTMGGRTAI